MEIGDQQPQPEERSPAQLPGPGVSFFAALRSLQTERQALVGRDTRPSKEPARLIAEASLAYPAAELASVTEDPEGRALLEVTFLGLFGPSGALPLHYTQLIIDRARHKDHALREFLNLFNHRWLSLFYRAWEKHDYPSAFQTSQSLNEEDVLTRILWCLIGLGTKGQRGRLRLEEQTLLHYAGLLSDSKPRESTVQAILSDWFSIQVAVLQYQGQWLQLPEHEQSRPQSDRFGVNGNNRLGMDTIAGSRVWNVENRFRLRLGPLRVDSFVAFSPMGERLYELAALTRTYVGPQFEFDVQVIVDRRDVPSTTLSGTSQLGWNTWLGYWQFERDADDAVFEVDDLETVWPTAPGK